MKHQLNRFLHFWCRLFNINRWYMRNINNEYVWWILTKYGEFERIGWRDEY